MQLVCLAATALILAITLVGADYATQQQQHSTDADTYSQSNSNGGYDQQQQAAPSKAKKIQIVYIKVPLAKLKPSLASGDYAAASGAAPIASAENATYAGQHDTTDTTRLQGSQSVVDNQDNQQLSRQQQQHQSSFLIPMAVVSNDPEQSFANSLAQDASMPGFSHVAAAAYPQHNNQQQHTSYLFDGGMQMHPFPLTVPQSNDDMLSNMVALHSGGGRRRYRPHKPQQSPVQLYHQLMAAQASAPSSIFNPTGGFGGGHAINQGFMSSFLMAEKEKMERAALRLQQQQQQAAAQQPSPASSSASGAAAHHDTIASSSSNASYVSISSSTQSPLTNSQQTTTTTPMTRSIKPGGLMPVMMMPFSRMPDSMIGQAYNAAVGQALPVESGSPANLLGSPSIQQQATSENNKRGNSYANGSGSGTNGASDSSLGITSNGSYGANGQSQQDNGSSGNGYQQSASGSGNSAHSSGYGSGTNSFGASVAFSDYPATPSTGFGPAQQQQAYAHQQLQPSSSNNNNNHHHNHLEQSGSGGDYGQKLRQAKKTIIPIVVQVEHAILENNQHSAGGGGYSQQLLQQKPFGTGNKYHGGRGYRQLGGKRGGRKSNEYRNQQQQQVPYGSATNESPIPNFNTQGQYIDAANAQDINQITAAINAENAASAAAALAQADMAFGNGAPAYMNNPRPMHHNNKNHHHNQNNNHQNRPMMNNYASGLQSAASALLANTHPVIQAAASGGLASVTKLGAKLGEMIALPSMPVPSSIASSLPSIPSALTSITSQMGVQLNQAVQQVAKEHPTAHAFARQVAQHAGLNLPNFNVQNAGPNNQHHQQQNNHQNHNNNQQMAAAASNQFAQSLSPQAQLQNLKLSIGQNLQSAAAQLMGVAQKNPNGAAQSAATLLANPLAALYPPSMNAALKQLSGMAAMAANQQPQQQQAAFGGPNMDPHYAQSSSLVPVQQAFQQSAGSPQQLLSNQLSQLQQQVAAASASDSSAASSSHSSPTSQSALVGEQSGAAKPAKSSLKSKFFSFFQPPKFISNLLSWNDRADDRNDHGHLVDDQANLEAVADAVASSGSGAKSSDGASEKSSAAETSAASKQADSNESASAAVSNGTSKVQQSAVAKESPLLLGKSSSSSETSASSAPANQAAASALASDSTSAAAAAAVDETKSAKQEPEASSNSTSAGKKN